LLRFYYLNEPNWQYNDAAQGDTTMPYFVIVRGILQEDAVFTYTWGGEGKTLEALRVKN